MKLDNYMTGVTLVILQHNRGYRSTHSDKGTGTHENDQEGITTALAQTLRFILDSLVVRIPAYIPGGPPVQGKHIRSEATCSGDGDVLRAKSSACTWLLKSINLRDAVVLWPSPAETILPPEMVNAYLRVSSVDTCSYIVCIRYDATPPGPVHRWR